MRESELLSHIEAASRGLASPNARVLVGPGDDCAVIETAGVDRLLLKVDQVVEGRHFARGTSMDLVARKAVARAASDVAAMAGTPMVSLCAATLPAGFPHARELFDAIRRWSAHFGCPVVGGDLSSLGAGESGAMVLGVTIVGRVHDRRGAVLRSGAREGDGVYVTGALGNSLASGRHLGFEPRLREARWLADALDESLHAMMDISDGLGRDAGRMGVASRVAIELEAARLPLHADAGDWRRGVADGEDYELLFTADGSSRVPEACPITGVAITRVGRVVPRGEGPASIVVSPSGERVDATELGWEHE